MIVRSIAGGVEVLAPAKLNLFLEVLGRRPDGYHEIESLMVAVNLYDTLTFTDDPFGSDQPASATMPSLPTGSDNLVVKAAERLKAATGCARGARISLTKAIPAQAGLAGGSSDAAATLVALDRLWDLRMPANRLDAVGGRDRQRRGLLLACTGGGLPRAGRAGGDRASSAAPALCAGLPAGRPEHGRRVPPPETARDASTDRAGPGGAGP